MINKFLKGIHAPNNCYMNKTINFKINNHHPTNKKKGGKNTVSYIRNRTLLFIIAQTSFLNCGKKRL